MAVYFAVLRDGPRASSDAYAGVDPLGDPTEGSEITGSLQSARYVELEAASVADAQRAVRIAYGATQTPIIVAEAAWKES